ncbi:DegV family protein [Helicovermis profundi]|uniref:DegV family protein n=1 Tax=Helicovermis profundi TaxID=3065157 RepID=A0AAU9EN52_9FIRM|nr:DegV family protein [Clostridia bacterium S502]
MGIKIITDSASDIPKELALKYNIEVLPLLVYKDGDTTEYRDNVDIFPDDMYEFMIEGGTVKTAQVSYESFYRKFEECINTDDEYIYIAFSSELSGTYQTSKMVEIELKEKYGDINIEIIDTKAASLGFGLIVIEAAKVAKQTNDKSKVLETIKYMMKNIEHIFTVDNLEYLYRGGRVSKASAVIGGVLNIKPILDVEDGKLIPFEKVRGRKKAIKRIAELVSKRNIDLEKLIVGINYSYNKKDALLLADMLKKMYGIENYILGEIGCSIGAHTGPGTLSVYFLKQNN